MEELSVRGGARVGWVNATWPFSKLTASAKHLKLSSLQGTYNFLPGDVISLQRRGVIPLLTTGVRIIHRRMDYPAKIIFWSISPKRLIEKIRAVAFVPSAPEDGS